MQSESRSKGGNIYLRSRLGSNIKAWLARLVRAPRPPARDPWRQWTLCRLAAGAVLIVAVLTMVTVLLDVWAITEVRHLPESFIRVFDEITDFGKSGWFLFPLGIFLLGIAALSPMLTRVSALALASVAVRAGFLFVAIAAPGLFTLVIKYAIGRARPYVTGVADTYAFTPFMGRAEYASFPSGHATTAFAAAVAIGSIWPHARPLMWIYALAIALSRVLVTAHYPSDVIASAVVGVIGALLVRNYFAARGLGFGVGPHGSVHAFAGPSLSRIRSICRAFARQS